MKRNVLPIAIPILVAVFIAVCYFMLSHNLSNCFESVERGYKDNSIVNLEKSTDENSLAELLVRHGYLTEQEDAQFAAQWIVRLLRQGKRLDAIFDLNAKDFRVPAQLIDSIGSPLYKEKLAKERIDLEINETSDCLYSQKRLPDKVAVSDSIGSLTAIVYEQTEKGRKRASAGVLVRLDSHYMDETDTPVAELLAYGMTGEDGTVTFSGLNENKSYSILPIRKDYSYGRSKGTTNGSLKEYKGKGEITFVSSPHTIKLFDNGTLRRIKQDGTITVRTPKVYSKTLQLYVCLFFIVWLVIFFVGRGSMDYWLASILMTITGISLLLMFGINDPLSERILGAETAQGIIGGIIIVALLQGANLRTLYQDETRFDIPIFVLKKLRNILYFLGFGRLKRFIGRFIPVTIKMNCNRIKGVCANTNIKGIGYLLFALLLTASLFVVGREVGGMKVNLSFFGLFIFQPSEIAKYLIVFFMAAYFCQKHLHLENLNREGKAWTATYREMLVMLVGLFSLMLLYLLLGDMGPALVLALTFIILYAIVTSKVNENENVLKTNLGMLFIGGTSFLVMLAAGRVLDMMGLMATAWVLAWIVICICAKRKYDAAIMFNLIIIFFVFGADIFKAVGLESISDRLEARNAMCVNTWGIIGEDGGIQEAGENSQVAEGLWGLASGGMWGQGIGNSSAHYIPAFHTDMILQSIGEQTGFIGILFIFVLMGFLLYRAIYIGFNSGHPFTLFLCTGIAVATAVQLFIIALGSTGVIPLTGITVPMLSYGKVSMLLNILAFGLVLSVSSHSEQHSTNLNKKYDLSISLYSLAYILMSIITLSVFYFYQVMTRDYTLIRPIYVNNTEGVPVVYYNPRINDLTEAMKPGDIYDRNGVLLATSEQEKLDSCQNVYQSLGLSYKSNKLQRRYYPFGQHLMFMIGDYNTKQFFSSADNSPRGYLAEARHLTELRGYDNVKYDKQGEPVRVDLMSDTYRPGRFFAPNRHLVINGYQLRDYSALLPYLKKGANSDIVRDYNNRSYSWFSNGELEAKDLRLTVDARLQTRLQQKLAEYGGIGSKKWHNFQRVSVVVIDAQNGDLLSSANWPLPDIDRLSDAEPYYNDNGKPADWTAYTDTDLGIMYFTPPGSTAKIMSALAGFRRKNDAEQCKYYIYQSETLHRGNRGEPFGQVDMEKAIVNSSNCYFIDFVNDNDLYDDLAFIYGTAGVKVGYEAPYRLAYKAFDANSQWAKKMKDVSSGSSAVWRHYWEQRNPNDAQTIRRLNFNDAWFWAWGQGTLSATPLAMARIAGIVATNGDMAATRFTFDQSTQTVPVISPDNAKKLRNFMEKEAKRGQGNFVRYMVGGKSGTPERVMTGEVTNSSKGVKANDAWYICYINNAMVSSINHKGKKKLQETPLAVAVRIERAGDVGSGYAKQMMNNLVLSTLRELGYLKENNSR